MINTEVKLTTTVAEFSAWIIPQLLPLRKVILKHVMSDSCVLSTAVVIKHIEKTFGSSLVVTPMSVDTLLLNIPYIEQLAKVGGRHPNNRLLQSWIRKHGAWSIGLGMFGTTESTGHLVALVGLSDGMMLVDLSLDQAWRFKQGIAPGPIAILVPDTLVKGSAPWSFEYINPSGCVHPHFYLGYERSLFDGWHIGSPDWENTHGLHDKILEEYYGK